MRLRHRSQELDFEEMNRSLNQDSRSNDSEITDFTFEIKSELYDEASQEPIDRVASPQVSPARKKGGRRKRKSAEEKAANVRARNRRAQQAFRKRQKALTKERSESMANLKEEIDLLRETNKVLQNTINQLLQELDAKSAPSTQLLTTFGLERGELMDNHLPGMDFDSRILDHSHLHMMNEALPDTVPLPDMISSFDFGTLDSEIF